MEATKIFTLQICQLLQRLSTSLISEPNTATDVSADARGFTPIVCCCSTNVTHLAFPPDDCLLMLKLADKQADTLEFRRNFYTSTENLSPINVNWWPVPDLRHEFLLVKYSRALRNTDLVFLAGILVGLLAMRCKPSVLLHLHKHHKAMFRWQCFRKQAWYCTETM